MTELLHELILSAAIRDPASVALCDRSRNLTYGELAGAISRVAWGLDGAGLKRHARVAIYLPKSIETVVAFFGAAAAGGIFVPVNPLLKSGQVRHILEDSGAEILITSADRLLTLVDEIRSCADLRTIITVDQPPDIGNMPGRQLLGWEHLLATDCKSVPSRTIDEDVVSIFYTSGSTGRPKGVVLTHRNMVAGARSVASYLDNKSDDGLLAVLPFSFDYGFSQLTTAFHVGARVVLLNYLMPIDILHAAQRNRITGLAGVPPLWIQLSALDWPDQVVANLRYVTNSGGKLPEGTIRRLRQKIPTARIFLMYGLTEAFRSTFLPPEFVDERPTSIGKAIPNAEIMVVRGDGTECDPDEAGELVHRGVLVAKGYWGDAERTRERFRPVPCALTGVPFEEIAVWSGDLVRRDKDGFLYFIGRNDELIKTSGYRVSPTEVEEALYASHLVSAAVVFGVSHPIFGQSIAAVVEPQPGASEDTAALIEASRKALPPFMVPTNVVWEHDLPRNPNGKLDRSGIIRNFRLRLEGEVGAG